MSRCSILVTDRLILRPAAADDVSWFHEVWTDSLVRRHLWQGRLIDAAETGRTLEACLSHGESTGLGLWRIHLLNETRIGFFGFWPRADERRPDVFMGLLPEFWKRGYGLEAVRAVFQHVFERGYADEVLCSVASDNRSSRSIMRKAGMVLECESGAPGATTMFYRLDAGLLAGAETAQHPSQQPVMV